MRSDIRVTPTRDGITLSGVVSNAVSLSLVLSVAEAYAPPDREGKPDKEKVINLLEVGGVQQVMIEVRVSEMTKTLMRNLGINFNVVSASGQQMGVSLLDNLTTLPSNGFPANPLGVSNNVNGILRFLGNGASWTAFIDALKENDLVKVLAEPTLITMSGKRASFLAGGEYPIPVPQALGTGGAIITIQYKTFGVGLNFMPTVLGNGKISMEVAPEVSELDFTNAISLQGYIVPSLTTRRTSTTVELADGQSFAVAGLLSEEVKETVKKFPVLGDIPVLGVLFGASQFQRTKRELVIIVTPHLVKPVDMARQTLPTDRFVEPDDLEYYLLGYTEGGGPGEVGGGGGTLGSQRGWAGRRLRPHHTIKEAWMRRLLCLSACAIAITALVGACTIGTSRLDADHGASYKQALADQVLNPDAGGNVGPVYGMNGIAAENTMDRYYKGFEEKKTPAPTFTIPIGRHHGGGAILGGRVM